MVVLLALLVGCGASVMYGEFPYKEPVCTSGDKDTAWDEYVQWNNVLFATRRLQQEYCVWSNAYTTYCAKLGVYHARVERYVEHLEEVYTDTCTGDEL
jgi:hypothetical protein